MRTEGLEPCVSGVRFRYPGQLDDARALDPEDRGRSLRGPSESNPAQTSLQPAFQRNGARPAAKTGDAEEHDIHRILAVRRRCQAATCASVLRERAARACCASATNPAG